MGNPFKDQFLKKGLVTKKQVNKAIHEQRLSNSGKKQSGASDHEMIQHDRHEQSVRDRERNLLHNKVVKEKEIQSQIRHIIEQNKIDAKGDVPFNFVDGNKIQKLYVDKKVGNGLSKGTMAIVKQDDQYAIVPLKAAGQIKDRKTESLILLNLQVSNALDPDDPYAEFPIPEDYEW
jgi:uncharacterized protein YaiL (DUF2058 family)